MKRTLSLVLALVMILGTFTTVFAATEAETTAAEFLAEEGILLGADGDLMLDKNLERRDAVVLLSRLLGVEEEAAEFLTTEDSPSWEDARTDAYYVPFFAWAEENGYFEGDDEGNFNPRNAITAQEYALVLLRALNYDVKGHDAWKAALETAEKLGLLKDVEVENADKVVRAQMAAMTFNALGTKMNDSDETLAEKLDIEMPEDPKAKELTADVYDTENLAEIVVELSNADLADIERLENASNYKLNDSDVKIKSAKVVGDDVVLLLDIDADSDLPNKTRSLVKGRTYTLTVRGIDRAINKDYKFKAGDITSPGIESVEVLGEYGIKVTTTEPVKDPQERNFQINGKRMSMVVEQYGRDIILTPYHSVQFDKDATELRVLELTDFAGHKSSLINEEIEIINDDVAPEIVSATRSRNGKSVTVVFDKDVYIDSVGGYASYRNVGNISYRDGRQTVYAEGIVDTANSTATKTVWEKLPAEKIATNVVVYTFADELPRNIEFTIEGVQNHSELEMERTSIVPTISLDEDAAEVVNNGKRLTLSPNSGVVNLTIKFDKNIDLASAQKVDLAGKFVNYKLYKTDSRTALPDNFITGVEYNTDKYDNPLKDELVVTFDYATGATPVDGLEPNVTGNKKVNDYTLEITNLEDNFENRIGRSYIDFEVIPGTSFNVNGNVYAKEVSGQMEFTIEFNKYVDKTDAEDGRNYVFTVNGVKRDLDQLNGEAIVERDGYTVTLRVPEKASYVEEKYTRLEILPRINTTTGQRISRTFVFNKGAYTIEGLQYIVEPAPVTP